LTPFCANFVSSNGEKLQQTETRETTTDRKKIVTNLAQGVNFGSTFVSSMTES
jgi:hypothetical protein